jgi:hypothetical protein
MVISCNSLKGQNKLNRNKTWELRSSPWWRFRLRYSGLWHRGDGGSRALRNVGILPQHYTASQPRRPWLESKSKWLHKFNVGLLMWAGIVTEYGLDDRIIGVRFPAWAGNFSLRHRVQTSSGAHPASHPVGTRASFPGSKADGAWSWPLTSI